MHYNENSSIFKRIFSVVSRLLPAFFWILLIFSFDVPAVAILTLISAFIHECGHEMYVYSKTGRIRAPHPELHGMKISESDLLRFSYREEALLYAAGPLANLCAAAVALPFLKLSYEYAICFIVINLTTAFSNLIPIRGYDGYGIIRSLVSERTYRDTAERALDAVSLSFTVVLSLISLYLADRFGEGYWIFAVFIVSLLSGISRGLKNNINEKK